MKPPLDFLVALRDFTAFFSLFASDLTTCRFSLLIQHSSVFRTLKWFGSTNSGPLIDPLLIDIRTPSKRFTYYRLLRCNNPPLFMREASLVRGEDLWTSMVYGGLARVVAFPAVFHYRGSSVRALIHSKHAKQLYCSWRKRITSE